MPKCSQTLELDNGYKLTITSEFPMGDCTLLFEDWARDINDKIERGELPPKYDGRQTGDA